MLFADLAGSTALGESLDPEDVRTVQEELFELVNGEVQRHEGVSEKFVGDAVLAVFGIPRAHEDDADRAVRAALAAQRDGSRIERMLGAIGAPTGPVAQAMHSTARALVDLTGGRADDAARALANAESELRAFGRHYDAACVALEVATALDAAGDEAGAAEARERAPDVLGPLGCVNPW
jgi:class 3 adenylate cyclase